MLASLRRILALIRKEILAIMKDARTRNMLLIQPVLQCLLFGYAATSTSTMCPTPCWIATAARPPRPCWPSWMGPACFTAWPI